MARLRVEMGRKPRVPYKNTILSNDVNCYRFVCTNSNFFGNILVQCWCRLSQLLEIEVLGYAGLSHAYL